MRLRPRLFLGALGIVAAVGCNAKEEKKKKEAPAGGAQGTETPVNGPVDAATIEKSLVEKGFFLGAGKHEWKEDEDKRKKHGWKQHPTVMEITLLSGEDDTPIVGASVSVALTKWHDDDFPGGKGGDDGKDGPMPCGGDDSAPGAGKDDGLELCLKSPVPDDHDHGKDGKDDGGGKGGGWHGGFDKGRRVTVHAGSSNVVTLIIRAGRNYEVAAKKDGFDVSYRTLHFDDRRGKFLAFPLKLWRDGGDGKGGTTTGSGMDDGLGKEAPAKDAPAKDDDNDHEVGPDDEVVDADSEKPEPPKPSDPTDGMAKPETVTRLKGCDDKESFNPIVILDIISKVAPKKYEELQKWLAKMHTLVDCSFNGDLALILKDKEGSPVPFIITGQEAKFDEYVYEESLADAPKPTDPAKPSIAPGPDGPAVPKPPKRPPHPFPMPDHDLELLHCDVRFGYLDDLKAFETALINNMPHHVAKKILKKKKAGAELVDCSTQGPGVRLVYVTGTGPKRARWVVHVWNAHPWLPHLWHQGRKKQKQDFFDE